MDYFYIDLHSNVVNKDPNFTTIDEVQDITRRGGNARIQCHTHASDFLTTLDHPINLIGDWEVGLVSITYPNNAINMKENCMISFYDQKRPDENDRFIGKFMVERGRYNNVQSLIDIINYQIFPMSGRVNNCKFVLDKSTHRVESYTDSQNGKNKDKLLVHFSSNVLPSMLGLVPIKMGNNAGYLETKFVGENVASVTQHNAGFIVYTNIIKPYLVGDNFVKSLQFIPFISTGDIGYKEYTTPKFLPLESNSISAIHITLRDSSGDVLVFAAGQVQITLKFQKR
jgi:hypothetical protein